MDDILDISVEIVTLDKIEVLVNLLEKYDYEFSQYEYRDVDDNGLYKSMDLKHYLIKENGIGYFIKVDSRLAGFVLISNHDENEKNIKYSIEEFFIMYKYKRQGVGTYVINYVFNEYKGKWQLTYAQKNKPANEFWNKVVKNYTNDIYEKNKDWMKYNDGITRDELIFET